MAPLAIDLYCGLGSGEPELRLRANSAIKKFVACGAQNPDHMSLRVRGHSPRAIAFEIWSVCDFKDARFSAGFACVRHVRIPALESIQRRVLVGARGLVLGPSFRILTSRPCLAQLSRSLDRTISRAISAVAVWWLDRKVCTASSAIATVLRSAFVLVSTYPPNSLRAIVAAPFLVWADCLERRGALSAKQIVHGGIVA